MGTKENIYAEEGYENRKEYLKGLSDDYGIPLDKVLLLAEILGPSEDFDGLISSLEDFSE